MLRFEKFFIWIRLMSQKWKFYNKENSKEWTQEIIVCYQVQGDAITDGYTPEDITAYELFSMWVNQIEEKCPNQLITIDWGFYACQAYNHMPFQFPHEDFLIEKNFLKYFTWPVDHTTGEKLNWLSLPVPDKKWNSKSGDKGGFIQEITAWKPSILQPFVYLPTLLSYSQAILNSN
jgi:hypothetical protein